MEVLVSFLEGDPDQPVVIGCLYNGDNKVPLELEGRKTQSGWRTVSSKGKGKRQEFIFEDKAGSEEIYLYGQRNHRVVFDEDESIKIGKNQATQIGKDQSTEVTGNRDIKVQGNQKTAVMGSTDLESLSDVRWSAGAGTVKYSMSNGMFNLEAAMSITLKAGASSISIGPAGISITGTPMVLINSGGGGGSASAAQKAKVQAVLDKLADRKSKGGSGAWTDPRKLGALAGRAPSLRPNPGRQPPWLRKRRKYLKQMHPRRKLNFRQMWRQRLLYAKNARVSCRLARHPRTPRKRLLLRGLSAILMLWKRPSLLTMCTSPAWGHQLAGAMSARTRQSWQNWALSRK
jgi:hypothetical protein